VEHFPNLRTMICGEGVIGYLHEKKIKELGLEQNVELTGMLSRRAVMKKMANSKILLHPSTFESQGYIFYEALHAGLQVISYDIGIADGSEQNWLVAKNEEEIFIQLKKLLSTNLNFASRPVETVETTVSKYCDWVYFND